MVRSDLLMGTVVEQQVYGGGSIRSRRIAAATAREIDRLEKLWSVFRDESEISRIGKAAGRAREIYRRKGVRSAVINLGGNVLTLGGRKDGLGGDPVS